MDHTLATIDVLIAAERLCRTQPVALSRLLLERQLRTHPTRVTVPAVEGKPARPVAVIPDAWFELTITGHQPTAALCRRPPPGGFHAVPRCLPG